MTIMISSAPTPYAPPTLLAPLPLPTPIPPTSPTTTPVSPPPLPSPPPPPAIILGHYIQWIILHYKLRLLPLLLTATTTATTTTVYYCYYYYLLLLLLLLLLLPLLQLLLLILLLLLLLPLLLLSLHDMTKTVQKYNNIYLPLIDMMSHVLSTLYPCQVSGWLRVGYNNYYYDVAHHYFYYVSTHSLFSRDSRRSIVRSYQGILLLLSCRQSWYHYDSCCVESNSGLGTARKRKGAGRGDRPTPMMALSWSWEMRHTSKI